MPMIPKAIFNLLMPLACSWAEQQEQIILKEGVPLTKSLLADARRIGISHPDRVRLRVVREIPWPDHELLREAVETTGLLSPLTIGLTLRYGIYIRADHWGDRGLVIHEM